MISRLLLIKITYDVGMTFGDVHYYLRGLVGERSGKPTLAEYPDITLWPLRIIDTFTADTNEAFVPAFIGFCLLIDAIFTLVFTRARAFGAAWFWIAFGLLTGPVFITRLDIISGALVGTFGLLLFSHPRIASAVLAAATAIKIWPGILGTALVGPARDKGTWIRIGIFALTSVVLALVTILTRGMDRLTSPFDYQTVRGLQVESIAATPFVLLGTLDPKKYDIIYAPSKSFEIKGPGVHIGEDVATWALYLTVLLAALIAFRRLRQPSFRPHSGLAFSVLIVLLVLVTNKVFSPQYLIWVAPLLGVALYRSSAPVIAPMAWILLVLAGLTQWIYPHTYNSMVYNDPAWLPVILLTLRNTGMVVLTGLAMRWLWWELAQGRDDSRELVDVSRGAER